jgi:O-antigen/teichoic acid export membrane protein
MMKELAGSIFAKFSSAVGRIFGIQELVTNTLEPQNNRSRERYRRAMISGASAAFSRLIWILTLLISVPLTVKFLGSERYGMWMTISSLIALLQFADLGVGYGLLNSVAESNGKDEFVVTRHYISSGFFYLLGLSLLVGIAFALLYPAIPWGAVYNVESSQALREAGPATAVFALVFLANIPISLVGKVQQGFQEGYIDSLWQTVGRVLSLSFLLLVIWLQLGLPWLVLAVTGAPFFCQAINFVLYFYFKNPALAPKLPLIKRESARAVLSTGFLFFLLQLVMAVAFASDTVVLAQFVGPQAVAIYTIVFQAFLFVPALVRVLLNPLWPAYGEADARGDKEWVEKTFSRSLKASLMITGLTALTLFFFGGNLVALWAGKEFLPPRFLLLSLGINSVLLYGWGDPVAMFLNGTGKVAVEVKWAIPMAIVNIAISILLTLRIGISGVAWGTSLSYFFLMVIPITLFLRRGRSQTNFRRANA